MEFTIQTQILFDTVDFSLKNKDTNDAVTLPALAGSILITLIKHHGNPIERSIFFDDAWREFGLSLSNNTLNQYISLLRKNLLRLGIEEEAIITLPKVGFSLSDSISVIGQQDQKKSPAKLLTVSGISLLLLIVLVIQAGFLFFKPASGTELHPVMLGNIGSCAVFTSNNLGESYQQEAIKIARSLADKYLPCHENSEFIFDTEGGLMFQRDGRAYLARCERSRINNSYAGCSEVLVYENR